jgi:hypothetical protein
VADNPITNPFVHKIVEFFFIWYISGIIIHFTRLCIFQRPLLHDDYESFYMPGPDRPVSFKIWNSLVFVWNSLLFDFPESIKRYLPTYSYPPLLNSYARTFTTRIHPFFSNTWYLDFFINKFTKLVYFISLKITYYILDKGIIYMLGPEGISYQIEKINFFFINKVPSKGYLNIYIAYTTFIFFIFLY